MINLLISFWFLICLLLAIFSYTQIDLNLTFINWKLYLDIQQQLIYLGYYQRVINANFVTLLFFLMTLSYLVVLFLFFHEKLKPLQLKALIFITAGVLFFSYNAFSHDFFNYMFDAKIFTTYGLNPYEHKALDFPNDDWIRFMHWVHRDYPYGPTWLGLTIIPSFLGFGKFLATYFLFKMLFVISYLIIVRYIFLIVKEFTGTTKQAYLATALFAFHPLIIIEGLVSPHLDIVMASFFMVSIFYFLKAYKQSFKKIYPLSLGLLLFSIGIKFATFVFLPFFNTYILRFLGMQKWIVGIFGISIVAVGLQFNYSNGLQTWYLLMPLTLLPLLYPVIKLRWLILFALILEIPLVSYIQFTLLGHW